MKKFLVIDTDNNQHIAYVKATNQEQALISYKEFLQEEGWAGDMNKLPALVVEFDSDALVIN